mmetsp:Transcript_15544/g.41971  ORF Transcript_15544/g.41971 Transcript_15544/m.41971 type:complete len:244 (+) Transcript_15544:121-852(+)
MPPRRLPWQPQPACLNGASHASLQDGVKLCSPSLQPAPSRPTRSGVAFRRCACEAKQYVFALLPNPPVRLHCDCLHCPPCGWWVAPLLRYFSNGGRPTCLASTASTSAHPGKPSLGQVLCLLPRNPLSSSSQKILSRSRNVVDQGSNCPGKAETRSSLQWSHGDASRHALCARQFAPSPASLDQCRALDHELQPSAIQALESRELEEDHYPADRPAQAVHRLGDAQLLGEMVQQLLHPGLHLI